MNCPCGCLRPVPHGRFWFDDKCRRKGNKLGKHMPVRFEKKLRKAKIRDTRDRFR